MFAEELRALIDEGQASVDRTFYRRFVAGELSRDVLRAYYLRLHHECAGFVRLVSLVHFMAEDKATRELVALNFLEEYALGDLAANHPNLALRVARAFGLSDDEVVGFGSTAAQRAYYEVAYDLARSSAMEGMTAMCFQEADLPRRCLAMRQALTDKYGVPASELKYYDEHISERSSIRDAALDGYGGDDVHVQRQLDAIAVLADTPARRERVRAAVRRITAARDQLNRAYELECFVQLAA